MSATDTPDNQLGVVSSQVLLATAPAATSEIPNVGLPTNCETLVVMLNQAPGSVGSVRVVGVQSGLQYPGVQVPAGATSPLTNTWLFDVSTVLDAQVNIFFANNTTGEAWAYADAGVHLSSDPSQAGSDLGQSYVVATAPSTSAGNHPPVDLEYKTVNVGNGGTVLAAPGAGQRYRVFTCQVGSYSTGSNVWLLDGSGMQFYQASSTTLAAFAAFPLTGLALSQNGAITAGLSTAGATANVTVSYTVESVF